MAPALKDSKLLFREAKIVEVLMKIVEIEVLLSISGYISLFFDLYNNFSKILGSFQKKTQLFAIL